PAHVRSLPGVPSRRSSDLDGVQMTGDGPVRAVLATGHGGANGAAAGQFIGHAEGVQMFGDIAHYAVGEAGGTGDGEHFQQYLTQDRKSTRLNSSHVKISYA